MTSGIIKSEVVIPGKVKSGPVTSEAETSPKRRSLMSTIGRILSIARKLR